VGVRVGDGAVEGVKVGPGVAVIYTRTISKTGASVPAAQALINKGINRMVKSRRFII
jgi:hypothetical protein